MEEIIVAVIALVLVVVVAKDVYSGNKGGRNAPNPTSNGHGNKKKSYENEAKAKMDEIEKALMNIVGLSELKEQLGIWAKGMLLNEVRRDHGIQVGARRVPHMALLGNPGTGKTTIARIIGRVLYLAGKLPTDKVIEVHTTDLVGYSLWGAGTKTRKKIEEAKGGILFVDEAYQLIPSGNYSDYGKQALEEIMSAMDGGKVVVVFAGYSEPMKRVISCNEGFRRRVTKFFHFDDFSCEELAKMLHLKMKNQKKDSFLYGFKLHYSCTEGDIATLIQRRTTEVQRKMMNGALVDQMLINATEKLDERLSFDCKDTDVLHTITLEDLEAGLGKLPQCDSSQLCIKETVIPQNRLSQPKMMMDELEGIISNMVGLHEVKEQLQNWAKGMLLDVHRRDLGIKFGVQRPPHMAFLGSPGTGKTMVARLFGRLLYSAGILPTYKVTEVQRTDLVGEYIGKTGLKTRLKIEEAEGGILFVDEAYRLMPKSSTYNDFGLEALEEIMSAMDSRKVVVIFAGYSEPMKRVISSNEGFRRRVAKFFHFNDFSCEELAQMLHIKVDNQAEDSLLYGLKLHSSCNVDAITTLIKRSTTEKQRQEMNGGLVDIMLVNARENLNRRLNFDCNDVEELLTLTLVDLEAGLGTLQDCM